MLRITRTEDDDGSVQLRLEGRLIGPWVDLLDASWRAEPYRQNRPAVLDLSAVTFASRQGLDLLARLRREGVEFHGCPAFLRGCAEHGT